MMLSLTDTGELRQTLSLVHKILDEKKKTLEELHGEDELDSSIPPQVCDTALIIHSHSVVAVYSHSASYAVTAR